MTANTDVVEYAKRQVSKKEGSHVKISTHFSQQHENCKFTCLLFLELSKYQNSSFLIASFFCCKLLVCLTVGWLVAVVYTQEQPEIKVQANAGAFQMLT